MVSLCGVMSGSVGSYHQQRRIQSLGSYELRELEIRRTMERRNFATPSYQVTLQYASQHIAPMNESKILRDGCWDQIIPKAGHSSLTVISKVGHEVILCLNRH